MKILFFGDRHYRDNKPASRIDDFYKTNLEKDQEILDIAKKEDVDLIIHPGDFFEKPNVTDEFFIDILKRWTSEDFVKDLNVMKLDLNSKPSLNTSFIPMLSVVGNHDVYGGDIKTLDNTKLGLMNFLGINKIVSKENPYVINTPDGLSISITGTSYHSKIDTPEFISDYIVEEKISDYHIHLVHGMLLDKKVPDDIFRSTIIDDILTTQADITLSGHDHIGFGIVEHDGKFFANPGAVIRQTADKKEINRKPKVIIIEITKADGISMKEIPLVSAKDGKDVLDRTLLEETKKKEILQAEYIKKIKDFKLTEKADIYQALDLVAKNENIDDIYKNDLVQRTMKKEEEMKTIASANDEVYIEKLILKNFQSHEDTNIVLDKGFNVLIGESSTGKTSIIRAIRWIYENKPSGRDFIMTGKDFATATVFLSNGYAITRKVESKTSGFNGYIIKDPNGQVSEGNTTLLPEVQKIVGFNDFIIDKDLEVPLNFMLQGDSWFLIGDKYSSIDRAKIIGAVKGTHYIDAVRRDLDKENKAINASIKKDTKEVDRLNEDLKEFDYLKDLKNNLDKINESKEELRRDLSKFKEVKKLKENRDNLLKNLSEANNFIKKTKEVDLLKELLYTLKEDYKTKKDIEVKDSKIKKIRVDLKNDQLIIEQTKDIDLLKTALENLKINNNNEVLISKLKTNYLKINKSLLNINKTIQLTEGLDIIKSYNEKLLKDNNSYNNLLMNKNRLIDQKHKLLQANQILESTKKLDKIMLKQEENKKLANNRHVLLSYNKKYKAVKDQVDQLDVLIKQTSKNDQLRATKAMIDQQVALINQISVLKLQKENLELQIINEDNVIKIENQKQEYNKSNLLNILNHIDTCPTCLNKVTDEQKQIIINSKLNL